MEGIEQKFEEQFDFKAESQEFLDNNYVKGIQIEQKSAIKALVKVTTLEDYVIEASWHVTQGGLKVNKIGTVESSDTTVYEDLHVLLQNLSPAYQEAFNNKLMEKLMGLQQMRRLSSDEDDADYKDEEEEETPKSI